MPTYTRTMTRALVGCGALALAVALTASAPAASASEVTPPPEASATPVPTPAPTPSATPSPSDPAKPAVLPARRAWVRASLDAAGNLPGIDAATTRLGVGTLPFLRFTRAIPDKAAVERHLMVVARDDATGREHFVAGAWGWIGDRTVVFRPRTYWPGRSTITITSDLDRTVLGVQPDGTAVVGSPSLARTWVFRTARKLVARVDGERKRMTVSVDGKIRKRFGVSLGTTDWETRNGVKVIGDGKLADKTYTSEALGITDPEEQYSLDAKWNTRLTPTGEFIHTATWAYGRIGRWNGSHGCTNMFEQDAKWIYDNTVPGDPVVYVRTGGSMMEPWNGPGGLWNIPWESWLMRSALATARPDTSNPLARTGPTRAASA